MLRKQVEGNVMKVTGGMIVYREKSGIEVAYGISEYIDGKPAILEAVYNLADTSEAGIRLVEAFDNWLRGLAGLPPVKYRTVNLYYDMRGL